MAGDNSLVIKINGSAKNFIDELDKVKKKTKSLEATLSKTAKISAVAFAGFAGSIAVVVKSFSDYEKALVGVGKTTNIEGKRLQKFGKEFQKLSSEIPVSTNELLGIAQAAGQLGVSGEENLLKFTDTIAKLGVATDLTGEQAATSLTRILNVTGESISEIDTFGSVIVALGNNFAATESEIVRMATEVARSTAVFGVTSAEAAALSTALKSVGVQAQLGGSATGRAFRAIDKAVREGGTALDNLAKVTGIAGDQLKKTFEDDATGVFQSFINGLGRIQKQGGSTTKALEAFGLKGDEILKVLPVLAKNSELLGKALGTAAKETKNATALNNEAEKAFATLSSTTQKVLNNFTNLKTNIGEALAPSITELLNSVNGLLKSLSELDKETVSSIASFLKWGAIITGIVASTAAFLLGIVQLSAVVTAIGAAFLPATIAASGFWVAVTGPIGLAIAGVAAVTAGFFALKNILSDETPGESISEIDKKLKELNKTLEANKKIARDTGKDPSQSLAVKQIQERIDKLEELRKKQVETSKSFGTGELLIRPKVQSGLDLSIPGLDQQQAIPLAPQKPVEVTKDKSVENLKKSEDEKNKLVDEATQKRIDTIKRENEALKVLNDEKSIGATQQELDFLTRKQAIQEEFAQAELIKNDEERALAIENLNLKHEEELAAIEEANLLKQEQATINAENKRAVDEELRQLELEQRAQITEEDLAMLQDKVQSENDILRKQSLEKINKKIAERNKFVADEIKHGTVIANINKFLASDEVAIAKNSADSLVQLSRSKNATLKGIGKAAARVNAAIATAEGAVKAYTSLVGIPIVGPVLGAAAAAAVIAFGIEQQGNISAMQTGGFVPPGGGGARDRIPALLEPNELVVPASVAPNFIQAAGVPDTQGREAVGDQADQGTAVIEIMLEDRAGEVISLEQREGKSLGIIGEQ